MSARRATSRPHAAPRGGALRAETSEAAEAGFLELLLFVSTAANEAGSLREALAEVLPELGHRIGWPLAHVYLEAEGRLEPSDLWYLADARLEPFRRVTRATGFASGEGLPGSVLARREPVWIEDVTACRDFVRVGEDAEVRLGTGLAVPICAGGAVRAVLELFHEKALPEDPALVAVVRHVGVELGRVAEREEARARIAASEQRFRDLAEHVDSLFWLVSGSRMEYLSPAVERMWGIRPESLSDDPEDLYRWIHEDDRDRVRRAMVDAYRARRPAQVEYRIVRPDGALRWLRTRAFPIRDGGRPARYGGLTDDITDELRTLDEVESKGRLLARTLEAIEEAVFVVEGATRRILECNRAAERITGYSRDELLGHDTRRIHVDEESFRRFREEGLATLERTGRCETTWELRRKDGSVFPSEHCVTLLHPEAGLAGGVVSTFRDVSARADLQRRLRHAQRMEALGGLAAGVAHDFNNLLTVVRGNADLLAEELPEGSSGREATAEILDAAGRAADLTWQLLAFGREQRMEPHPVRLDAIVGDLERLLRRVIGEDVELRIRLPGRCPAVVVDPTQIQQVLVNLAVNARDAMPRGGVLRIETAVEDVPAAEGRAADGLSPGRHVVLTVSDTGHGMDATTQARIFEPFFTTKPKGVGTGLGLASVYGIVRQSGGAIEVDSAPGEGTTFRLAFPAAHEETQGERAKRALPATGSRGVRILVVEDDEAVARVLERILARAGHRVERAGTVAEARARGAGQAFDLVVSDAVLPDGSGLALLRELRARTPRLRALLTSGYREADAEGLPYLPKPFTPEDVVARVEALLRARD